MPSGNSASKRLEEAVRTSVKPVQNKLLESKTSLRDRHKRPDKQIYVPRALRGTQKTEELLPSDDKDKKKEKRASTHPLPTTSSDEKHELETITSAKEIQNINESLFPCKVPMLDEISTDNNCQEDERVLDLSLHQTTLPTLENAMPISPKALSSQPDQTCSVDKTTILFSKDFIDNPIKEGISEPETIDSLATSSKDVLNAGTLISEDANENPTNELDVNINDSFTNELHLKSAESHAVLQVSETVTNETVLESKEICSNSEVFHETNQSAMDVVVTDRHETNDFDKCPDTNEKHLETVLESKKICSNSGVFQETNQSAMDVVVTDRHEKNDLDKCPGTIEKHLETVLESKKICSNSGIFQETNQSAMDVEVTDRHEKNDINKCPDTNEKHSELNDAEMSIGKTEVDKISCDVSSAEKDDSWECKFNDDGECLSPELVKELINVTGRMKTLVAKNSFSKFQPLSSNTMEGYDTIVELYDFPQEFKTQDLVSALSFFLQSSYTIKWVDDIHALAIFTSPALANQALQMNHSLMKVRPISEGIKESKSKARWCETHLEPPKPRPTTSAVLARRLVSGALGLRVQPTKEQRDYERNVLNQARERRKQKSKQKQDIWNGVVS